MISRQNRAEVIEATGDLPGARDAFHGALAEAEEGEFFEDAVIMRQHRARIVIRLRWNDPDRQLAVADRPPIPGGWSRRAARWRTTGRGSPSGRGGSPKRRVCSSVCSGIRPDDQLPSVPGEAPPGGGACREGNLDRAQAEPTGEPGAGSLARRPARRRARQYALRRPRAKPIRRRRSWPSWPRHGAAGWTPHSPWRSSGAPAPWRSVWSRPSPGDGRRVATGMRWHREQPPATRSCRARQQHRAAGVRRRERRSAHHALRATPGGEPCFRAAVGRFARPLDRAAGRPAGVRRSWRGPARALGATLLGAADSALPSGITRLVVIPDWTLHRVPFDALRSRRTAPRSSAGPSGSRRRPRWRRTPPASRALRRSRACWLLATRSSPAPPSPSPCATPSPIARRSIGRAHCLDSPAAVTRPARSPAMRRPALTYGSGKRRARAGSSGRSRPCRVIHLATHALVDETSPANTQALLLGGDDDGFVSPGDGGLHLDADLAPLGLPDRGGRHRRGRRGAGSDDAAACRRRPRRAATQWRIGDRSTVRLVDDLYAALAHGRPVAEALARRSSRRSSAARRRVSGRGLRWRATRWCGAAGDARSGHRQRHSHQRVAHHRKPRPFTRRRAAPDRRELGLAKRLGHRASVRQRGIEVVHQPHRAAVADPPLGRHHRAGAGGEQRRRQSLHPFARDGDAPRGPAGREDDQIGVEMEPRQIAGRHEAVVVASRRQRQDRIGQRGLVHQRVGGQVNDPIAVELRPLEPALARLFPEPYVGAGRRIAGDLAGLVTAAGQSRESARPIERRAIGLGVAHGEGEGGAGEDRVAKSQQA